MALTRVKNPGNFTVDGSVGIGTSSFNSKLEVKGNSANGSVRVIPNSDNAEASIGYYQDTAGTNMTDRWVAGVGGWGNTNQFTIGNSGSPKLKIDTSGRITAPNNPAFCVHTVGSTGGVSYSGGDNKKITPTWSTGGPFFNRTGSGFDMSTSKFTAPIDGIYSQDISYTAWWAGGTQAPQDGWETELYVNGTMQHQYYHGGGHSGGAELRVNATCLLELLANDYVEWYFRGYGQNFEARHWVWQGHLVG